MKVEIWADVVCELFYRLAAFVQACAISWGQDPGNSRMLPHCVGDRATAHQRSWTCSRMLSS